MTQLQLLTCHAAAWHVSNWNCRQTSIISGTLVDHQVVDHSDVIGVTNNWNPLIFGSLFSYTKIELMYIFRIAFRCYGLSFCFALSLTLYICLTLTVSFYTFSYFYFNPEETITIIVITNSSHVFENKWWPIKSVWPVKNTWCICRYDELRINGYC